MKQGDVAYIYPMVPDQGRLTLRTYYPIVMDLIIPCGEGLVPDMDFNSLTFHCVKCPYNEPISCDCIRLKAAEWSAGDVFNPPKLTKARVYSVDLTTFLTPIEITEISKEDKTEAEKTAIFVNVKEQPKTLAVKKEV